MLGTWDDAAEALRAGLVVALPTDTVYGLAVDPTREGATGRLFEVKQRPTDVALPVLVASADQAGGLSAQAMPTAALERWWPGPLTVVVLRSPISEEWDLGGDATTIGLRCPAHDEVRRLCLEIGPLAVTSANLHGQATPSMGDEVDAELGDVVALVVDGGLRDAPPSTVVDLTTMSPTLLREGAIPWSDLEPLLKEHDPLP